MYFGCVEPIKAVSISGDQSWPLIPLARFRINEDLQNKKETKKVKYPRLIDKLFQHFLNGVMHSSFLSSCLLVLIEISTVFMWSWNCLLISRQKTPKNQHEKNMVNVIFGLKTLVHVADYKQFLRNLCSNYLMMILVRSSSYIVNAIPTSQHGQRPSVAVKSPLPYDKQWPKTTISNFGVIIEELANNSSKIARLPIMGPTCCYFVNFRTGCNYKFHHWTIGT